MSCIPERRGLAEKLFMKYSCLMLATFLGFISASTGSNPLYTTFSAVIPLESHFLSSALSLTYKVPTETFPETSRSPESIPKCSILASPEILILPPSRIRLLMYLFPRASKTAPENTLISLSESPESSSFPSRTCVTSL